MRVASKQTSSKFLITYICGAPRLHLRYPDVTMGASVEVRVEFKTRACLLIGKSKEGLASWEAGPGKMDVVWMGFERNACYMT